MADVDALIIGGGSGLTAAYYAEADGKSVGLVERGPLGGTCVNRGCIPTKTLIQAAETMRTIREAKRFGIQVDPGGVEVDFPAIMARMREMRADNVAYSDAWIEDSEQIELFRGEGRFVDDKTFAVDGEEVTGDSVFICAGARPALPPMEGLDDVPFYTNQSLLDEMDDQPGRLVVLGGGFIGVEFAHLFASIGTDVTVIEAKTCLLREDPDVRSAFTKHLGEWTTLYNGWYATHVEERGGELHLDLEEADGDETDEVVADALLVATGRKPNTDMLGLDNTQVELDDRGFVQVDEHLRTTQDDTYAYGDVIGQGMFKHTSSFEGAVAWTNSQGADEVMEYRSNPHAVFTRPQIGSVGLTEEEAEEEDLEFRTATLDYGDVAKGEIVDPEVGFAKALVEEGTDRILGFHVVGPQAADLVHEVVVAMDRGDGTVGNVTGSIHVHPTLSELVHTLFSRV